jgi:uncharacterized protein YgiM (DUF1202 family)
VSSSTLNLRSGPSSNSTILETLLENEELLYLAMQGDWIKVKTKSSNKIGYVYSKFVSF